MAAVEAFLNVPSANLREGVGYPEWSSRESFSTSPVATSRPRSVTASLRGAPIEARRLDRVGILRQPRHRVAPLQKCP